MQQDERGPSRSAAAGLAGFETRGGAGLAGFAFGALNDVVNDMESGGVSFVLQNPNAPFTLLHRSKGRRFVHSQTVPKAGRLSHHKTITVSIAHQAIFQIGIAFSPIPAVKLRPNAQARMQLGSSAVTVRGTHRIVQMRWRTSWHHKADKVTGRL